MANKIFAIMGATGHIGHVVVEELLKQGHQVRAIGRDKNKLKKLKELGAIVFSESFDDAQGLAEAFKGVDAILSFIPPAYSEDYETYSNRVSESIQQAIVKDKIKYVVNLSSIGANVSEGVGPIAFLHKHEKRLNAIPGINVVHFRPGYFMENLFRAIPDIKSSGKNASPLKADIPIPMVATHDIATAMVKFLNDLSFKGSSVFEFLGPQAMTPVEITAILGKAIGKPELKYEQLPIAEAEKKMLAAGMKPKTAKVMLEMYKAVNEGKILPTQQLTPEHFGKTKIEEFAKEFAKVYKSNAELAAAFM